MPCMGHETGGKRFDGFLVRAWRGGRHAAVQAIGVAHDVAVSDRRVLTVLSVAAASNVRETLRV